jgi:hypothetical protein
MSRDIKQSFGGRGVVLGFAVALACVFALAPGAAAKSSSQTKSKTTTAVTSVPPGGGSATAASCPKSYHVTGGGYAVAPSFSPGGLTGTRSESTQSQAGVLKSWLAGASAYSTPPQSGTLTVYARCEPNSVIKKLGSSPPNSSTIPVGLGTTVTLNCPGGAKILNGGYVVSPPPSLANPDKRGAAILQSHRASPSTWTIQIGNPSPPAGLGPVTFSTSFLCEQGGKKISEISTTVPISSDNRTSADVSCSKKKHVVSGGYTITPNATGAPVPAVEIDEFNPSSKRAWHLGLYELTGFDLPAGSAVTLTAYCKPGK